MRQDQVPWAYRVFSRQVGIDPDDQRTPVEQVALDRLKSGGLREPQPRGRRADDRDRGDRRAGDRARRRPAWAPRSGCGWPRAGERLGGGAPARGAASSSSPTRTRALAVVLGEVAEDAGVTPRDAPHGARGPRREGRAADQRRGGALDRGRDPARRGLSAGTPAAGGTCQRSSSSTERQPSRRPRGRTSAPRAAPCWIRSRGSRPSWRSSSAPPGRARASSGTCRPAAARASCRWRELEELRDELAERVGDARRALSERTDAEEQNRQLIEEMLLEPERAQVGAGRERGHRRAGLQALARAAATGFVGMLAGWWRVVISSGCPLAT